jgi:hypothetical protein
MIDITKTYKTVSGKRVINLSYVPFNSNGDKATYPIKGTIIVREKPLKKKYYIWSEDGIGDVVLNSELNNNLVLDI